MSSSPPEPKPPREPASARWLRWAGEDLELAAHTAADTDVVPRGACVWAHQAAEKALKALLAHHDIDPPKWHDLDRLVERLPEAERPAFGALELPELTRWAIEGRYPAHLDDATVADATKAIGIAESVLAIVTATVATPGPEQDDAESM